MKLDFRIEEQTVVFEAGPLLNKHRKKRVKNEAKSFEMPMTSRHITLRRPDEQKNEFEIGVRRRTLDIDIAGGGVGDAAKRRGVEHISDSIFKDFEAGNADSFHPDIAGWYQGGNSVGEKRESIPIHKVNF